MGGQDDPAGCTKTSGVPVELKKRTPYRPKSTPAPYVSRMARRFSQSLASNRARSRVSQSITVRALPLVLALSIRGYTDIQRAMAQFNTLILARAQESDRVGVHQSDFAQIKNDGVTCALKSSPQGVTVIRPEPADYTNGRRLPDRLYFNP